ncbi:DUF1467 family protein [Ancylobacter dichloromethanicus]
MIFAVLPFGVRSQHEDGVVEDGTEPGAPQRPLLLRKALVTTVVAAVIVLLFAWLVETERLRLDMFPMPFQALRREVRRPRARTAVAEPALPRARCRGQFHGVAAKRGGTEVPPSCLAART